MSQSFEAPSLALQRFSLSANLHQNVGLFFFFFFLLFLEVPSATKQLKKEPACLAGLARQNLLLSAFLLAAPSLCLLRDDLSLTVPTAGLRSQLAPGEWHGGEGSSPAGLQSTLWPPCPAGRDPLPGAHFGRCGGARGCQPPAGMLGRWAPPTQALYPRCGVARLRRDCASDSCHSLFSATALPLVFVFAVVALCAHSEKRSHKAATR